MANEPLFIQFANTVKQKVLAREYKYGDKLPTEEQLSQEYGINRKTVRKAKNLLISEGILLVARGKGVFFNRPPLLYNQNEGIQNSFTYRTLEEGSSPLSKVLFAGKVPMGNLARVFRMDKGEQLYRLVRIRYRDDVPNAVEDAFIPYGLIPDIEKYNFSVHSLYAAMMENDVNFEKGMTRTSVIRASSDIANALQVSSDSGIFKVEFTNYGPDGSVYEYTKFYSTGDKVDVMVPRGG